MADIEAIQKENLRLKQEIDREKIDEQELIDLITEESEHHPIQMMCRVLKMPKSTYYQSFHKKLNSYHVANEKLLERIQAIHKESQGRYGASKIYEMLKKKAIQAVSIEFNV